MMMKTFKTKLTILFLFVILLIGVVSINSFANEDETVYESVSHHYFTELKNDIPLNVHGTCTHVAMSSLLSFYDVYWNDAFVEDRHESLNDAHRYLIKQVPGAVPRLKLENRYLSYSEKSNKQDYMDFVDLNKEEYLHMYLISLADELGCYEPKSGKLSISFEEAARVFDKYFDNVFGNGNYYREDGTANNSLPVNVYVMMESSSGDNRPTILNKMKEELSQKNPVLYCGYTIDRDGVIYEPEGVGRVGHSMVAYHETDDGDILLHKGHIGTPEDTFYDTVYKFDIGILWIEINEDLLQHECTQDFDFYDEFVCSCKAYGDMHPEHVHEDRNENSIVLHYQDEENHLHECKWGCKYEEQHIYTYEQNSENSHYAVCACGYYYDEPHTLVFYDYHNAICECGYSYEGTHNFTYNQSSDDEHSVVCECGYTYSELHTLTCESVSGTLHSFECVCGYSYFESHDFIEIEDHIFICSKCEETHTTPHGSIYQQLSETHHLVSCECGYVGEAPHNFTYTSISASSHNMSCECGYEATDTHNFKATTNPRYQSCTRCGYTRDNFGPGGNVQMGVTKEEELE